VKTVFPSIIGTRRRVYGKNEGKKNVDTSLNDRGGVSGSDLQKVKFKIWGERKEGVSSQTNRYLGKGRLRLQSKGDQTRNPN